MWRLFVVLLSVGLTSSASVKTRAHSFLPSNLRICAFNIKTFGRAKMSDPTRAAIIRDIVKRYDIILIQEIRDSSGESLQQLWDMVGRTEYTMVASERLGRSTYKEQYAFFFRLTTVQLMDIHQYDDGIDDYSDPFEREPYSIRVRPVGGTWDLALTGVHIKPGDAVAEIGYLNDVYLDLKSTWSDVQDFIIMGDLNADCSYTSESDLLPLDIYDQSVFYWPLGFDADTTTSTNTNCAYDRFLLSGPNVKESHIPGSEGIYEFEQVFGLDYAGMMDISDHYPIEIELI